MNAKEIYDLCCDMDYRDYEETQDADLAYIQTVIDQHGQRQPLT